MHVPKLKASFCFSGHINWRQTQKTLSQSPKPVVMNNSTVSTHVFYFRKLSYNPFSLWVEKASIHFARSMKIQEYSLLIVMH